MTMIYAIVGPTGSGKTSLACSLAKDFNLPIINADAFQIYQEMNIGTAKIEQNDSLYKSHYLIDIVKPDQNYSVKQYQADFDGVIHQLLKEHKDIIICGGTGLYLRAALYDYSFPEEETVDTSKYDSMGNEELYELLKKLDPQSTEKIHMNNRKRVIRALIIAESGGLTKSENIANQEHTLRFPKEKVQILFLNPNREQLYQTINERVEQMFASGLVDEVKELLQKYQLSQTASQAIGYKETIDYLNGLASLEECKELIKKRSRNYAKRQITFFKHQFETIEFIDKNSLFEYLKDKLS